MACHCYWVKSFSRYRSRAEVLLLLLTLHTHTLAHLVNNGPQFSASPADDRQRHQQEKDNGRKWTLFDDDDDNDDKCVCALLVYGRARESFASSPLPFPFLALLLLLFVDSIGITFSSYVQYICLHSSAC